MAHLSLVAGLMLSLAPTSPARADVPIPFDEPLHYRVTWLGVHCADMTLESAPVAGKPMMVEMVMTVSTTELFDGIYKVRSRIESLYNTRLLSTRRYHEQSTEKDRTKEDLWLVDARGGSARRTKNGVLEVFEIPAGGVNDPLAMLYRLRALAREAGDEASVTVMTTRGAVEATAVAERWEQFETMAGDVQALKVVQESVGDDELGRGGGLTMWLSSDERRVPYRIDFDLPFGKLVAELVPEPASGESADDEAGDTTDEGLGADAEAGWA